MRPCVKRSFLICINNRHFPSMSHYYLLSEHRLSEAALQFIERIRFEAFHLEDTERFEHIGRVNNDPMMKKQIAESSSFLFGVIGEEKLNVQGTEIFRKRRNITL